MIKITVNSKQVDIEMQGKKNEVALKEIAMAMHAMGYCLRDLRDSSELSDAFYGFAKTKAMLAFVDGYNGTDPEERYTHDGN